MGGNAFLSPWHFPRGAHGGQTCWEAIVCSELAFTGLQECVFTVAVILVSPDLTISPQSSQDKVGHYLEIITQGSSCNQHQCCLSPGGAPINSQGRPCWCGWVAQVRGRPRCCVPRGVPRASESPKKYICFVENATPSSSFYYMKLRDQ